MQKKQTRGSRPLAVGMRLSAILLLAITTSAGAASHLTVEFDGPETYTPGTTGVEYVLTITNSDPDEATPSITTDFPASDVDISWTCEAMGSDSDCSGSGSGTGNLDQTNDTVGAGGGSLTYTFSVDFDAGLNADPLSVTADVTHDTETSSASVDSDLALEADLSISKTAAEPSHYVPGESVAGAYTIEVGNAGPSDATGIALADSAPAGMTIDSWSCEDASAAACGSGNDDISATFDIPAGEAYTWTLDVSYAADATADPIETEATVTIPDNHNDPDDSAAGEPHSESASTSQNRRAEVDLSTQFPANGAESYTPGTGSAYTVTLGNGGPSDAEPAKLVIRLENGNGDPVSNEIDASTLSYTCVAANPCPVTGAAEFDENGDMILTADLAAGQSVDLEISVDHDPAALTDPLVISAGISATGEDNETNAGNESDAVSLDIDRRAEISLTKTASVEETAPNSEFEYFLEIHNAGPSDVGQGPGDDGIFVEDIFSNDLAGQIVEEFGCDGNQPCWTYCSGDNGDNQTAVSPTECPTEVLGGSGHIQDIQLSLAAGNTSTVVAWVSTGIAAEGSIDNTASVEFLESGPISGDDTANNSDSVSLDVIIGGDLFVTKTDDATLAVPGTEHSYTVTVTNDGFVDADEVRVEDALPLFNGDGSAGFEAGSITYQCEAFDGACCNHNSSQCGSGGTPTPAVTADVLDQAVDLPGQASVVFTITGTLHPRASGTLENSVSITPRESFEDPDLDNNTASDTNTELVPEADLVITKQLIDIQPEDGPPYTLTYQIDVTNNGPSHIDDGVIRDTLTDTQLEVDEDSPAIWTCEVTNPAGATSCNTSDTNNPATDASQVAESVAISPGGSVRVLVDVRTSDTASGRIGNTATIESAAGDVSTTISSGLTGTADLAISKTSNLGDIAPGNEIEYIITVSNEGPDDAFGARVSDIFPPEIENVAWTCEAATPVPGDLEYQSTHGNEGTSGKASVISGNGRHVYAIYDTDQGGSLVVFDRNATPGLSFGNIAVLETEINGINDGSDTGSTVSGLDSPIDLAIAPDGNHVYVLSAGTSEVDPAVATFARNTDPSDQANYGRLTFIDRVTEGLPETPRHLTLTDTHLYVSGDEHIGIFEREPSLGLPQHQQNLESDVPTAPGPLVIDPSGPYLFAASSTTPGVHAYTIAESGGSDPAGSLGLVGQNDDADTAGASDIALAPDASHIYLVAAAAGQLVMLDYSGLEAEPVSLAFAYDEPQLGVAGLLDNSARLDIAIDGEHVLLTNEGSDSLLSLRRDPISGGLDTGNADVLQGNGATDAADVLITPDGRHVLLALEGSAIGSLARYSRRAPDPLFAFIEKDSRGDRKDPDNENSELIESLQAPNDIAVSPEGDHVYAVSLPDNAIVAFRRDPTSGATDDTLGEHLQYLDSYFESDPGVEGLARARRILISRDGRSVFVTSEDENTLAVFDREHEEDSPDYGKLSFRSVYRDGENGIDSLSGAQGMAIDGSGRHLYVAGRFDNAITIFSRELDESTGHTLLSVQATVLNGQDGVTGLGNIRDLAVAPDGAQVLGVSSGDNALVVFDRDNSQSSPDFGSLRFVQDQRSAIGVAPVAIAIPGLEAAGSGEHVYVAGQNSHSLAVLRRVTDPSSSAFGQVQPVEALTNSSAGIDFLSGPRDVEVSPDGKRVYAASENSDAVLVFDRDLNPSGDNFGRLNAVEIRRDNVEGVAGIAQVRALAVSRDSRNVYAAGFGGESVASFLLGTGSLCTAAGGGDIDDLVDIGVGGTLLYRARGTVRADASGELSNTADVAVPERFDDPEQGNNSATDTIDLVPEADLALTKSTEGISVTAGERTRYDITITNPGPSNLVHEAGMPLTVTDSPNPDWFDIDSAAWTCEASGSGTLEFIDAKLPASQGGEAGFERMRGLTGLVRFDVDGSIPALAAASVIDSALLIFPLDEFTGEAQAPLIIDQPASLDGARSIAVSSDGRHLYVASRIADSVSAFELSDNGGSIEAELLHSYAGRTGLDQAIHLVLGPNDEQLYVAGVNDDAIAVFDRNADGSLTWLESEQNGVDLNGEGNSVSGLLDVEHLAFDPDGEHLYALSGSDGEIAIFERQTDGRITWQGSVDGLDLGITIEGAGSAVFSPAGDYLYVAAATANRIAVLERNAQGELALASSVSSSADSIPGLNGVRQLLLTDDGTHLYATSPTGDSIIWFVRDAANGSLDYGGVRSDSSSLVDGLAGATDMAIDEALNQLYVAGTQQPAISRFQRQADSFCPASGTGAIDAVEFDIAAGGTVRFTMEIDVLADVEDEISNTAALDAARDEQTDNNSDTQSSQVSRQADLSITKDDNLSEIDGLLDAAALVGTDSHVYVAGRGEAAIAILERDSASGELTFAEALRDGEDGLTGLNGVSDLALDGTADTLYATARGDNTLAVFRRHADGGLEPLEVLQNGVEGVSGISGASRVAVSPDDAHVYVTGEFSNAVAVFKRIDDPGSPDHGRLQHQQTIENGVGDVDGLVAPVALAIAADGQNVYVLGRQDDTLAVLSRITNSGSTRFGELEYVERYQNNVDNIVGLTGVRDLAIGGDFVYVLGDEDGTLAVFERDASDGRLDCVPNTESEATECFFRQDGIGDTAGLTDANALMLNEADAEIHVAGNGVITRYAIDADDGTPAFVDQIANGDPAALTGGEVFGLENTADILLSPDGLQLYTASAGSDAVVSFERDAGATGTLEFADILIDGLGGIPPGEDVFYTIVVENHGPSDALDATVFDEFPEQFETVSWSCTSGGGANCPQSGNGDIDTSVELPIGGRVTFSAGGPIKDDATGRLINTASVDAGPVQDPNPANNQATDDDTILAPAMDLAVSVENGVDEVTPGLQTTWQVRVSNRGPSYARDIQVKDILPAAAFDASWQCLPEPRAGVLQAPSIAVDALGDHRAIAFSGNGQHAYAAGLDGSSEAIAMFRRNAVSGELELEQKLVAGNDDLPGLAGLSDIALSPDGRFLFAAAPDADGIASFVRDTTSGELTFSEFVRDGDPDYDALGGVTQLLFGPDGSRLYAISGAAKALLTFEVDSNDGALTQLTTLRNGEVLPDEDFSLDGLNGPSAMAWSRDHEYLLIAARANRSVTAFARNSFSGELQWAAITMSDGSGLLEDPAALAVSAANEIFVASPSGNRIDLFDFALVDGEPVFSAGGVIDADALGIDTLPAPSALLYDPDRRRLYVTQDQGLTLIGLMRNTPEAIVHYSQDDFTPLAALHSVALGPDEKQLYSLAGDLAVWPRRRGSRCDVSGGNSLSKQKAQISAGGNVTYLVRADLQANATGELRYSAEAGSLLPDQEINPADNRDSDIDELVPAPDLVLAKSASPEPVIAGEEIAFRIDGLNNGSSDALEAALLDTPPIHPDAGGLTTDTASWTCEANPPLDTPSSWNGGHPISAMQAGTHGVYAVSADSDSLLVFPRDGDSLASAEIVSATSIDGLAGASGIAVSEDERHLYVTGRDANALVVLTRDDPSESFSMQAQLRSGDAAANGSIAGMIEPVAVALSSDGDNVYVLSDPAPLAGTPSVVVFSRDPQSGALEYVERQADGLDTIAPESNVLHGLRTAATTKEGLDLYTVAYDSEVLAHFDRDDEDGALTLERFWRNGDVVGGETLDITQPVDLAAGPADQDYYLLVADGVVRFEREDNGGLTPAGRWTGIPDLGQPRSLHVDPAGTRLYLLDDAAIHVFARDWSDGSLEHRNRIALNDGGSLAADSPGAMLWTHSASELLAFPELALSRCMHDGAASDAIAVDLDMGVGGYFNVDVDATVHPSARGEVVNIATITPEYGLDPDEDNNLAESRTQIEVVSDIAVTKTGPVEAVAGETIEYRFVVTNDGPSSALGLGLIDFTEPTGVLLDAEWTCSATSQSGLGDSQCPPLSDGSGFSADLLPNDELIIDVVATVDPGFVGEMTNTAELVPEAGSSDPTTGDQSSSVTTEVEAVADVAVTKTLVGDAPVAGDTVRYEIVIDNPGPSNAPVVAVSDEVDDRIQAVQWTCQGSDGGACPAGSGSGNPDLDVDVPAGGSVSLTVSGLLPASATGILSNTVDIAAAAPVSDPEDANNSATTQHTIAVRPDLEIELLTPLNPFDPDGTRDLPMTVRATNHGPSDARDVLVDFGFDAGVTVAVSGCPESAGRWICDAGTLRNGESRVWEVLLDDLPEAGQSLQADALVSTSNDDPLLDNNSATRSIELVNGPDVDVEIDNNADLLDTGAAVTYTLTVTNIGSVRARDISVSAPLSDDLLDGEWTCSADGSASCQASGTGDIDDLIDLEPGETARYLLTARVDPAIELPAGGSYAVSQEASASLAADDDINTDNNSDIDSDPVREVLFRDRFEAPANGVNQ